ncbi:protein DA1-related 1-like [Rutidosis leptorrhynchoides]|uniref:protein DA1-related 1-like n=1 Tax=Rutidosis leptorrhynchoides TaxID=125765 RepID=UPI003A99E1D8
MMKALKGSLKLKPSPWKRILNKIGNVFLCHVCNLPLINYMVHPFWANKYCPFHECDGTPKCNSCGRIESRKKRYVPLKDGRKVCLECLDSAVMDTNECLPLYVDVQCFYEGLDMKVQQNIHVLLVEKQTINKAMYGEPNGHNHGSEIRGCCLYQELVIQRVVRQLKFVENWLPDILIEPYKVLTRGEVKAILILYGLPCLLTGSVLAHEMMHVWLWLNGYRNLDKYVEEGIYQVLAHMWLISQIDSTWGHATSTSSTQCKRSPFEKKLAKCFKYQIEYDTSKIYGDGFRAANKAVLEHGLQNTLHHIRLTGNFPN